MVRISMLMLLSSLSSSIALMIDRDASVAISRQDSGLLDMSSFPPAHASVSLPERAFQDRRRVKRTSATSNTVTHVTTTSKSSAASLATSSTKSASTSSHAKSSSKAASTFSHATSSVRAASTTSHTTSSVKITSTLSPATSSVKPPTASSHMSSSVKVSSTPIRSSSSTKTPGATSHTVSIVSTSSASSHTTSITKTSSQPTGSKTTVTPKISSTKSAKPSATPVRNTGKRGLAYTNDSYTPFWSLSGQDSQVSWAYNWYSAGSSGNGQEISNSALTYIPMLWSDADDLVDVWSTNAQHGIDDGADALLAFNEPDACYSGSSCMSVNDSVQAYIQNMEPFAGKARLGAPAVTNVGLTWLDEFLGNCTECTIDFVPIHWYSNVYAFGYLQTVVEAAYNLTLQHYPEGKPIWLTEFGILGGTGGTEAQIETFLQEAIPWLDAVTYIERYAWFYDGPGYMINANGTGLSEQGLIFNSYTAS